MCYNIKSSHFRTDYIFFSLLADKMLIRLELGSWNNLKT